MGENAQAILPWSDAPFLLALSRFRTFMGAAQELRVDRTTVARRLDRLEAGLGAKLFERKSGELELTPHGRRVLAIVERAEQELSHLQPDKDDLRISFGKVRLALSPHVLAGFSDVMTDVAEAHPEIFLEFATSDRFVDLHRYEADIALRVSASRPDKLHCLDLGPVRFGLYRRSDQSGPVQSAFSFPGQTSMHEDFTPKGAHPTIVAAVDGVLPTRELVLSGAGAGVLPEFLTWKDPRLALCSDGMPRESHRLWMSCLPEQRHLSRIKSVMRDVSRQISGRLDALHKQD